MASFTVSVELRNATQTTQRKLRMSMAANGFRHSARCDAGATYQLPRDEYVCISFSTRYELLARVFTLVSACSANPAILITESVGRVGMGLDEVIVP